jgi:hypothetical protein
MTFWSMPAARWPSPNECGAAYDRAPYSDQDETPHCLTTEFSRTNLPFPHQDVAHGCGRSVGHCLAVTTDGGAPNTIV